MAQKIQIEYEANISKLQKDLKKLEAQQSKVKKQAVDTGQTLTNLSTKQAKQLEKLIDLRKTAVRIGKKRNQEAIRALDQEIAALKKAGTATKQLTSETKKLDKRSSGLNKTLTNIGRNLAIAFSIGALIQFGKQLNRTALEMEAFQKRAAIVFGDSIELVKQFAAQNAISLGLTEIEFQGATAAIGDLVVPLGLSRQTAAEMSIELVKVGVALKEFTGDSRDAKDISDILARSLTGEIESLKPLGVSIDQTSKEFKDLVKIKMEDENITALQAKALTIYEFILQRSNDAITSLAENTDSLSLAQGELGANIRTLNEELATLLTPALKAATGAILDQIEFINDSSSSIEKLAKILQFLSPVTTAATIANNLFNDSQEDTIDIIGASLLLQEDGNILTKEEIRNVFFLQKAIKELTEERKAQGTSLARVLQITEELKPLNEELSRLLGKQKDLIEDVNDAWKKLDKTLREDIRNALRDTSTNLGDEFESIMDDLDDFSKSISVFQEQNIIRLDNLVGGAELAQEGLNAIAAIQQQNTDAQIRQLETLGLTQEEFAKRRDELIAEGETKQKALFIFTQSVAAFTVILELQKEIARISAAVSLNVEPVSGAITKAALITGAKIRAALSLTAIAGATIAGLKEGEVDIQGGERGKDSIPAMIMPGESVIKTKATGKYKEELIAANNLNLESFINNKYVLPAIVKVRGEQAFAERWMQENAFDETGIVRQLKKPVKIENYRQMAKEIARQSSDYNYFRP